jgi:hypothetical protein
VPAPPPTPRHNLLAEVVTLLYAANVFAGAQLVFRRQSKCLCSRLRLALGRSSDLLTLGVIWGYLKWLTPAPFTYIGTIFGATFQISAPFALSGMKMGHKRLSFNPVFSVQPRGNVQRFEPCLL